MSDKKSKEKFSVLIVDDDPTLSEVMRDKFEQSGHTVYPVLDPKKALFEAEQNNPDVIVLDLMMTRLSGTELLIAFKDHADLKGIPVLVFSNKDFENEESELIRLGAAKCLVKSDTSLSELVEVVKKLVAKS